MGDDDDDSDSEFSDVDEYNFSPKAKIHQNLLIYSPIRTITLVLLP